MGESTVNSSVTDPGGPAVSPSTATSTDFPATVLDRMWAWLSGETWRMPVVVGIPLALLVLLVLLIVVCCVRRRRARRKHRAIPPLATDAGATPGTFVSHPAEDDDENAVNVEAASSPRDQEQEENLPQDLPEAGSKSTTLANPKPLPAVPVGPVAPSASHQPDEGATKPVISLRKEAEEFPCPPRAKYKWNTPKFGPRPMPPTRKSHRLKDSLKRSRHNRGIAYAEVELISPVPPNTEKVISTEEPTQYAKIAGTFQLFSK